MFTILSPSFSSSSNATRCHYVTLLTVLLAAYCATTVNTLVDAFHSSSDVLSSLASRKMNGMTTFSRHNGGVYGTTRTRTLSTTTSTSLFMGKLRSKQADLQRKMMMAKKMKEEQQRGNGSGDQTEMTSSSSSVGEKSMRMSDAEMKEQNDRKRFEELLASSTVSRNEDYLTEQQELENIDAYRRGVDRLFEGDEAPVEAFEELVSIKSENAIGKTGAKRLLPWLRNTDKTSDFLIVLCDPRMKSSEFRETANLLQKELPKDLLSKVIFINADTPAENRRWLKKTGMMESISVYSDEKMEWMRSYTALGETRWSTTLFVLADQRVQKLVRELSSVMATNVVQNAVKAAQQRRL